MIRAYVCMRGRNYIYNQRREQGREGIDWRRKDRNMINGGRERKLYTKTGKRGYWRIWHGKDCSFQLLSALIFLYTSYFLSLVCRGFSFVVRNWAPFVRYIILFESQFLSEDNINLSHDTRGIFKSKFQRKRKQKWNLHQI